MTSTQSLRSKFDRPGAESPAAIGTAKIPADPLQYALVTPSFRMDVERCALLIDSIERFVPADVHHYLLIDHRDVPLFRPLLRRRTEIIVAEDLLPSWLMRVPGIRRFWVSLRTRPVRNWMLQQIIKLSVPAVLTEEILLYTDSDVLFIAPYDPHDFEIGGSVPLFMETGQRGLLDSHIPWNQRASKLLGLPVQDSYDTNFIGNVVCWRRSVARNVLRRVESVTGRRWQQAIAALDVFAEYTLYGMYATELLDPGSLVWRDGQVRTLNYWGTTPLDVTALEELRSRRQPNHHSVMISAKSHTAVPDIARVFLETAAKGAIRNNSGPEFVNSTARF